MPPLSVGRRRCLSGLPRLSCSAAGDGEINAEIMTRHARRFGPLLFVGAKDGQVLADLVYAWMSLRSQAATGGYAMRALDHDHLHKFGAGDG